VTETIQTLLLLLAVLVAVAVLAERLKTAPSILLVVAGIALALVPGLPRVELAPEFVLLVILPPLIYSAGVQMSWREFRFNLRPIALLAIGCVVFTTCAVAAAAHWLLGWQWGTAFLLGAIVAPPDVVAPLAIARRIGLPRRIMVILEGEGLANDATALILYRFAVAAVSSGEFSIARAGATFSMILVGEIVWGLFVGLLSLRLRQWARNPRVEITLSLMTPYLAYWVPQHFGGSGVLATVATGLYVSWNGPRRISAATRLQGIFFWDLLTYLIEGFVFLLTGLETRMLTERAHGFSIREVAVATMITAVIVIVARFVWIYPATYLPRWFSPSLRRRDPSPPWQLPFALAFTGVRGVVSLAAALAIPLTDTYDAPFPRRDLTLFITFAVILITLVGQGLLLPSVMRWLGLLRGAAQERRLEWQAENAGRVAALSAARRHLDWLAARRKVSDQVVADLKARHEQRMHQLATDMEDGLDRIREANDLKVELITVERDFLHELLREGRLTDESRRRVERELDLEEEGIACKRGGEAPL
jgi:CPA1 family monovalent cation:H+ antiporter